MRQPWDLWGSAKNSLAQTCQRPSNQVIQLHMGSYGRMVSSAFQLAEGGRSEITDPQCRNLLATVRQLRRNGDGLCSAGTILRRPNLFVFRYFPIPLFKLALWSVTCHLYRLWHCTQGICVYENSTSEPAPVGPIGATEVARSTLRDLLLAARRSCMLAIFHSHWHRADP